MSQWTLIMPCLECGENIVLQSEQIEGTTVLTNHRCHWCGEVQSFSIGQRKGTLKRRPALKRKAVAANG